MISVSPVGLDDIEVVTLELEEDVGDSNKKEEEGERDAPEKVTGGALEKQEGEEEEEIVEVGRVRKRRTVRRSTGVGGKAPHLAINFRQVRKSLPVAGSNKQVKVKEVPEYFDVEDEEEEEEEEDADDVQVG